MEHYHRYVSHCDLNPTIIRGYHEADPFVWHRQRLWLPGLVNFNNHLNENTTTASVGGMSRLGQLSAGRDWTSLASMEIQTAVPLKQRCGLLLLPQKHPGSLSPAQRIQWCIRGCLCRNGLLQNGRHDWCCSHFPHNSKVKSLPNQRISIPHLKLCGALLLSRLLYHIK